MSSYHLLLSLPRRPSALSEKSCNKQTCNKQRQTPLLDVISVGISASKTTLAPKKNQQSCLQGVLLQIGQTTGNASNQQPFLWLACQSVSPKKEKKKQESRGEADGSFAQQITKLKNKLAKQRGLVIPC